MKKVAGEAEFVDTGYGTNAQQVFDYLVGEAEDRYGSRGYTGTIAEKSSFRMSTREVMGKRQAEQYANRHTGDYDKYGPAGCVAFGEEKVVAEKEFEIQVKAFNARLAREIAVEKMSQGRVRKGAVVEVVISYGGVEMTSPAGKRKINTERATGETYFILGKNSADKYATKKEAVAALKSKLETARNIEAGRSIPILKVQDQGSMSYSESSKLPTFTVKGKRVQKKIGKVKGYVFFGWASS
jgi:hypothetical protein